MEIDSSNLSGDSYDLIIVGSGPAGLTLARKYDELATGKTLIVESGHRSDLDSDAQKLSVMDASGVLPAAYYPKHNQRVFGGTSSVWNGWCAVLEKRSFLNHEWPFTYDELYKWYPEASKILGLPEEAHASPEKPFPDNPDIIYKPYFISGPPSKGVVTRRFADLFGDWLTRSGTVGVLFNHTVTNAGIRNGAASSIFIRESSGGGKASVEVFGRRIVLAAGGIQNARLLQLSLPEDSELPVGRYFCEHPHYYGYAELILDGERLRHMIGNDLMSNSSVIHAISLSSEFSHTHRLMSATFDIQTKLTSTLSNNLLGRRRNTVRTNATVRAEMSADSRNRVTLGFPKRDLLGQPVAHVALKFDPRETLAAWKHLNSQLIRSGLGRMGVPLRVKSRGREIQGGGHMMGTTRMGSSPTLSVTDAQGQVHGVKNLYVAGSSLFPAAAAANPTFTIVALSLRLAAHLAEREAT